MHELKATPGDWQVSRPSFGNHIEIVSGRYCVGHAVSAHENAIDNAHLMAASRKLYEKLAKFVALVEDDSSEDFLYEFHDVVALLARARGE